MNVFRGAALFLAVATALSANLFFGAPTTGWCAAAASLAAVAAFAFSAFRLWSAVAYLLLLEGALGLFAGAPARSPAFPAVFFSLGVWGVLETGYLGSVGGGVPPGTGVVRRVAGDILRRGSILACISFAIALCLEAWSARRVSSAPPGVADALVLLFGAAGAGFSLGSVPKLVRRIVSNPGDDDGNVDESDRAP